MEMISEQHLFKIERNLETAGFVSRLTEIAAIILPFLSERDYVPERTGLYLATSNSGVQESILFWKNALESSPRFANPANFSQTLSNGPAGLLSQTLQVKGPCYTMIGRSEADEACNYHASVDLETQIVDLCLVARMDYIADSMHFRCSLVSFINWKD
jgi:3-oxoacyl-(acyl-carrier-protein) synthase